MRPLTLLLCLATTICNAQGTVKLHGNITHRLSDSISVTYTEVSIMYKPVVHAARLDKNGNFKLTFSVPYQYNLLRIVHGAQETQVFAEPGADLGMTINAANFDSTLRYTGRGSVMANFIARQMLVNDEADGIVRKLHLLSKEDPETFNVAARIELQKQYDVIDSNSKEWPASFIAYYKASYQYSAWYSMLMYPIFHEVAKKHTYQVGRIPKEDWKFTRNIPAAFDDKYLCMQNYRNYVENYLPRKIVAEHALADDTAFMNYDTVLSIARRKLTSKTGDFFTGNYIYSNTLFDTLAITERRYEIYKKNYPNSPYLKVVEEKIASIKSISAGKRAVDFPINTPDGLRLRLSDLKGKVVLIDFWGSNCPPCLAEMAPSKKVRAHFKGRDVAFVYVSEDGNDSTWLHTIKKLEIDGYNTRLDNASQSLLAKQYGVQGIPTYFLLDKKGNFASDVNLPRPSETDKLIDRIEALLK